jgi:hypothetical protein
MVYPQAAVAIKNDHHTTMLLASTYERRSVFVTVVLPTQMFLMGAFGSHIYILHI